MQMSQPNPTERPAKARQTGVVKRLLLPLTAWAAGEYFMVNYNVMITIIYLITLYGFTKSAAGSIDEFITNLDQTSPEQRGAALLTCILCLAALYGFYATASGYVTTMSDGWIRLLAMSLFLDLGFRPLIMRALR